MDSARPAVILHVLDDLGPGGAERQLIAFVLRADRGRFRHEVCVLATAGPFAAEMEAAGIRVHVLGLETGRDLIRPFRGLLRVVREINPEILHATLYRPGVVSRVVGRLTRTPVVTSLVNTTYEPEWYQDNPRLVPWKVWLTRMVDASTARWWGTRFVAITEAVKVSAVRQLGLSPDAVMVIPRGVAFEGADRNGDADRDVTRAAFQWSDADPLILNVARLVPQKGQQYAVMAMTDVVRVFPRAHLVIVGEGWLRPTLASMIRDRGLEEHVTLLGERQDVGALLHAADLFVFPSIYEGLGNALLEAMAAGKPCVVSRIPPLREVTGDGTVALLAEPRSAADLAANLLRVATDPGLAARLGTAARAWARDRYDIRRSVAAWESVYETLASRRAASVEKHSEVAAR